MPGEVGAVMKQYVPHPMDTSDIELWQDIVELGELLARNTHEVWAQSRVEQGWVFGEKRDDVRRETPCLVEYEELSEEEKDYDRHTAMETLKVIVKLGYKITRD